MTQSTLQKCRRHGYNMLVLLLLLCHTTGSKVVDTSYTKDVLTASSTNVAHHSHSRHHHSHQHHKQQQQQQQQQGDTDLLETDSLEAEVGGVHHRDWRRIEMMDANGLYWLEWWLQNNKYIYFRVTVNTRGFIGLGFSRKTGHMAGADLVMLWVDDRTGEANALVSNNPSI